MSANTKIEWCDGTVNWWAGCTPVSPACDKCYAERMAGRLWGTQWGPGQPRTQFAGADAALKAMDRKAKRLGQPLRVFHNSLSDFFDKEVPMQWRISALRSMLETPNLIHLVLTKRIGNAAEMLETAFRAVHEGREGWADNVPPHIWIGATIVNQEEADRDIPKLLAVPAAKRFLSMEPLLGQVNLRHLNEDLEFNEVDCLKPDRWDDEVERWRDTDEGWEEQFEDHYGQHPAGLTGPMHAGIDWVIVGGESGPDARPMHPQWAFDIRDQCEDAGVAFMFKQWGEWTPGVNVERERGVIPIASLWNNEWQVSKLNLATDGGHIDDEPDLYRVGKKEAGRHLDGRTWDGVPT